MCSWCEWENGFYHPHQEHMKYTYKQPRIICAFALVIVWVSFYPSTAYDVEVNRLESYRKNKLMLFTSLIRPFWIGFNEYDFNEH